MPKPKPVTLSPVLKSNQKANPKWHSIKVLVEVNAQTGVTDKTIISWVREAIESHHERHPIQEYTAPLRISNPDVKSYSRWRQARNTQDHNGD